MTRPVGVMTAARTAPNSPTLPSRAACMGSSMARGWSWVDLEVVNRPVFQLELGKRLTHGDLPAARAPDAHSPTHRRIGLTYDLVANCVTGGSAPAAGGRAPRSQSSCRQYSRLRRASAGRNRVHAGQRRGKRPAARMRSICPQT